MDILMILLLWYAIGMSICISLDVITKSKFENSEYLIALIWPVIPIVFLVFETNKIIDRLYRSRY